MTRGNKMRTFSGWTVRQAGRAARIVGQGCFSPAAFFQAQAACAVITPALISPLVRYARRRPGVKMPPLVISVGTKLAAAQRARLERQFPDCALLEYYGSAETGYVSLVRPEDAREAPETVGR